MPTSVKADPIFLISEYGDLLNIKSMARSKTVKTGKTDYREVRMIDDNTTAFDLLKFLNQYPNTYFMFNPQKGHYTNSRTIFNATKKLLNNKYYGVISKK